MSRSTRIGLILKGYPRLSEVFVLNEILLLERLGHRLHIFAMRDPGETKVHDKVRSVQAPVTYIPDDFRRSFLAVARVGASVNDEALPASLGGGASPVAESSG